MATLLKSTIIFIRHINPALFGSKNETIQFPYETYICSMYMYSPRRIDFKFCIRRWWLLILEIDHQSQCGFWRRSQLNVSRCKKGEFRTFSHSQDATSGLLCVLEGLINDHFVNWVIFFSKIIKYLVASLNDYSSIQIHPCGK